jgi:RNA polymerase sigma-70 factor (ECF subfamily)
VPHLNLSFRRRVYMDEMMLEVENDAVLIGRIVNGEAEAARALVERHSPTLRRFALRAGVAPSECEDLLQETWIRVVRSAHRYDPDQPFSRWLFAIAMNRIRTRWERSREARDRERPFEPELEKLACGSIGADNHLEENERAVTVRALVSTLPRHLADTILLRYFEELSEREVASSLGIPVGTVKSRLHYGLRRLRLELERILNA